MQNQYLFSGNINISNSRRVHTEIFQLFFKSYIEIIRSLRKLVLFLQWSRFQETYCTKKTGSEINEKHITSNNFQKSLDLILIKIPVRSPIMRTEQIDGCMDNLKQTCHKAFQHVVCLNVGPHPFTLGFEYANFKINRNLICLRLFWKVWSSLIISKVTILFCN